MRMCLRRWTSCTMWRWNLFHLCLETSWLIGHDSRVSQWCSTSCMCTTLHRYWPQTYHQHVMHAWPQKFCLLTNCKVLAYDEISDYTKLGTSKKIRTTGRGLPRNPMPCQICFQVVSCQDFGTDVPLIRCSLLSVLSPPMHHVQPYFLQHGDYWLAPTFH